MLKLPYALSNGQYIPPSKAQRGIPYKCPSCMEEVRVRGGKRVRDHFFHLPGKNCGFGSSGESDEHLLAKLMLRDYLKGGGIIDIKSECSKCLSKLPCREIRGRDVGLEVFDDPYIYDVAIRENGSIVGVIEVLHKHRTFGKKITRLDNLKYGWCEVSADDVPLYLLAEYLIDRKDSLCPTCEFNENLSRFPLSPFNQEENLSTPEYALDALMGDVLSADSYDPNKLSYKERGELIDLVNQEQAGLLEDIDDLDTYRKLKRIDQLRLGDNWITNKPIFVGSGLPSTDFYPLEEGWYCEEESRFVSSSENRGITAKYEQHCLLIPHMAKFVREHFVK